MATWATSFWPPSAVFRARIDQQTANTVVMTDADPFILTGLPNDDVYLYSKRIDNSRLVRQADAQVQGEWSAIGGAFVAALLVAGLAISPKVTGYIDSYKIQDLKREQTRLLNDRRKLEVVEEQMLNAARLDMLAAPNNLVRPGADQVIHLQPKNNRSFAMNGFKSR